MTSFPTKTEVSSPGRPRRSLRVLLVMGLGSMAFAVIFTLAGYVFIDRGFQEALARYNEVDGPLAQLGVSSMETLLRARRYEKDFLLAARKLGTVESRGRYASLFTTAIEDLRSDLARIAVARQAGVPDLGGRVATLQRLATRYESGFEKVMERRTELGFADTGQEGRMREAADALEKGILAAAPAHHAALLMLRRAEKDFILMVRPKDAQLFKERSAALAAQLARGGTPKLVTLLDEYERGFSGYVAVAGEMDRDTRAYLAVVADLEPLLDALQNDLLAAAGTQFQRLGDTVHRTLVIAGIAALLVFAFAAWIGWRTARGLSATTREFSSFAGALARGESGARLGSAGKDDFGLLGSALDRMADSLEEKDAAQAAQRAEIHRLNRDLEARVAERTNEVETANRGLTGRNNEMSSLSELSHVMLASRSLSEVFEILPRFLAHLFPGSSGRLFSMNASANFIESRCAWGNPILAEDSIGPEDCWALRRGATHAVDDPRTELLCAHQKAIATCPRSLCLPLTAQNEGLGLLYIEPAEDTPVGNAALRQLAGTAAEQLALGIANMRMREQLRTQSIRDVLTGLYNRRFLEESADRELHVARRKGLPLTVIMLDVDHFKKFNDANGHAAGDEVLKAVGALLRRTVRASDICCRYGGEEFTVLMPEAGAAPAMMRAEQLCAAARELRVGTLPAVTLSLGVAVYPDHGTTWEALLRAADTALYEAKRAGRDRIALSGAPEIARPASIA